MLSTFWSNDVHSLVILSIPSAMAYLTILHLSHIFISLLIPSSPQLAHVCCSASDIVSNRLNIFLCSVTYLNVKILLSQSQSAVCIIILPRHRIITNIATTSNDANSIVL